MICTSSWAKCQITGFEYRVQDDSCYLGLGELSIDSVIGGSAPYTFTLDTLAVNSNGKFDSLPGGIYKLQIQDTLGNGYSEDVEIPSSDTSVVRYRVDDVTGLDDGFIEVLDVLSGPTPLYYILTHPSYLGQDTFFIDIRIPDNGTFEVLSVNSNGCIGQQTVRVASALPRTENFFSPNGDGNNDTWSIANINLYPNNKVVVFNRFGQRVFGTKNYQNDWDGKQFGQDLPEGTYYFVFYHDTNNDSKGFQKGFVEIIR